MMRFKGKTAVVRTWRRAVRTAKRVPFRVRLGLGIVLLCAAIVGLSFAIVNSRYQLSDAQKRLLGVSGVTAADIKETATAFTYNMAEDIKDDPAKQVVTAASESDSTSKIPYKASLSKDSSKGITFGDANGQLSFDIIPKHNTMDGRVHEGRVVYPTATGQKSVYTFKRNGVKEDILLPRAPGKVAHYSWELKLGSNLEARIMPDGGVGIFSANPYLYDDLQVSDEASQKLVDNARKNGKKDNLVFSLPAPFIVDAKGRKNIEDVSYQLTGNILTLEARNLENKTYPLSIDPTVVVTTTADFRSGFDDGMVDYTTTSNQIARGALSVGSIGAFTTDGDHFATPRSNHSSVAYNGYLYVIGGATDTIDSCDVAAVSTTKCDDVQYAPINSDGSIGAFTTDGDHFSVPRYFHSSVAYNGYLYVIGGVGDTTNACDVDPGSTTNCDDVQYAPINSNGSIGAFTTDGDHFSKPRNSLSTVVYNGYLYVIGGSHGVANGCEISGVSSTSCDDVQYAPINADGSIGAFTTDGDHFNYPRWGQAALAYNGRLYVMGGINDTADACETDAASTASCDDVQYAPINSNGSIGAFTTDNSHFAHPRWGLAAAAYNGYLYVTGGESIGGNVCETDISITSFDCNDVQYAQINADGSVSAFTLDGDHFSQPRYSHTSVVYNNYLYVVGGQGDDTNSDDCETSGFTSTLCDDVQYAAIDAGTPTFGSPGSYTAGNYFSTPRFGHASVVYNGYLYIIGGNIGAASTACKDTGSSTYCNDVQYAPINNDGSIGTFTTNSTYFSIPRFYATALAYNGYLYVIGGSQESADTDCKSSGSSLFCSDVQYAPINSNGSVGTFTTSSNYLSTPRRSHGSVAYNGYLYVVGGTQDNTATCKDAGTSVYCNDVQYAAINSNGSIGSFTVSGNYFIEPRAGLATAAYNGYLYIIAGNKSTSDGICKSVLDSASKYCNDIQYAAINSNGSIGTFTTNAEYIIQPRSNLRAFTYNGYLYLTGGNIPVSGTFCKNTGVSSNECNDTQYASINSDGSINAVTTATGYFSSPRDSHSAIINNGFMYIMGGDIGSASTACKDTGSSQYCNDVQYAPMYISSQRAYYERIFDTGESATNGRIDSIAFNGQTVCSSALSYRTASSTGVFGSTTEVPFVRAGDTVSINQTGKRYLWVRYSFDDQSCGTQTYATDITMTWSYAPPDAPTLNSPADGVTGMTTLQPVFQMRSPQANNSYLRYKIEICSNSDCSTVVRTIDQTSSQTGWTGQDQQTSTAYTGNTSISSSTMASHTYQTPALNWATQYWWRAYAIDPAYSNTFSSPSVIRTFSTNYEPSVPTLISPANNASNVSTTPDLRIVSTDGDGDYIRYKIEICSTSNCSVIVRTIDQTSSQTGWQGQSTQSGTAYTSGQEASHVYQPVELNISTQYWWRAYAIDPGGTNLFSAASSIGTFTTGTSPGINVQLRGGTIIKGGTTF